MLTPETFLDAISEGSDPTAADKATIDNQIRTRQIKIYVYNSQNSTPDVQAQVDRGQGSRHPGHHGHRDARARRCHVPGLAGQGSCRASRQRTCTRRPGKMIEELPLPALSLRDVATRVAGRTLWRGVTVSVGAGRVRLRARPERRRQVHDDQGHPRPAPGRRRRPGAGGGRRARPTSGSATCRSGAASTRRRTSGAWTSSGSAWTGTAGACRCRGAGGTPGWPR